MRGTGAGLIPRGPEHPAYRAARFVAELVGESDVHFRLVQENDIPPTRGLGGSAAALVGGAVAANESLRGPDRRPRPAQHRLRARRPPRQRSPCAARRPGDRHPHARRRERRPPRTERPESGRRRPRLRRLDHGRPARPARVGSPTATPPSTSAAPASCSAPSLPASTISCASPCRIGSTSLTAPTSSPAWKTSSRRRWRTAPTARASPARARPSSPSPRKKGLSAIASAMRATFEARGVEAKSWALDVDLAGPASSRRKWRSYQPPVPVL